MTRHKGLMRIVCGLLVAAVVAGCGTTRGWFGMDRSRIDLQFEVSPELNPDPDGQPAPLVIHIYELRGVDDFEGAAFSALNDREGAVIGPDLLGWEELEFQPGEKRHIRREVRPQARFIGILGAYRDPENARWRASFPLKAHDTSRRIVHLGSLGVSVTAP